MRLSAPRTSRCSLFLAFALCLQAAPGLAAPTPSRARTDQIKAPANVSPDLWALGLAVARSVEAGDIEAYRALLAPFDGWKATEGNPERSERQLMSTFLGRQGQSLQHFGGAAFGFEVMGLKVTQLVKGEEEEIRAGKKTLCMSDISNRFRLCFAAGKHDTRYYLLEGVKLDVPRDSALQKTPAWTAANEKLSKVFDEYRDALNKERRKDDKDKRPLPPLSAEEAGAVVAFLSELRTGDPNKALQWVLPFDAWKNSHPLLQAMSRREALYHYTRSLEETLDDLGEGLENMTADAKDFEVEGADDKLQTDRLGAASRRVQIKGWGAVEVPLVFSSGKWYVFGSMEFRKAE